MKYENLKSLILTILVLTSLVLTWNLWTYQPAFDYIRSEKLLQDVEISKKQEVANVIQPTKMLFHFADVHYGTTTQQEISRFSKEMKKWSLYDIEQTSSSNEQDDFISFIHGAGKMEIIFPDEIPLQTLRYLIGFSEGEIPNISIDRILIDIKNQSDKSEPSIYLVNYNDRRVHSAKVNNMSFSTLEGFYQTSVRHPKYLAISATEQRRIFVPAGPVQMSRMHYISEQLDPENFKNALFSDPSFVTKDQMSLGEVFTDGSRLMSVDRGSSRLQYVNPVNADLGNATDFNVIERSIDFVNEHSGWTDKYLFANWDRTPQDHSAVFRLYVDDYPVFNLDRMSVAEMTQVWRNNEVYQYARPTFELKFPLESQSVNLPSGREVENELEHLSTLDFKNLQDVAVGYELKRDIMNEGVIIFEPVWIYQENNTWNKVIFTQKDNLGGM